MKKTFSNWSDMHHILIKVETTWPNSIQKNAFVVSVVLCSCGTVVGYGSSGKNPCPTVVTYRCKHTKTGQEKVSVELDTLRIRCGAVYCATHLTMTIAKRYKFI
jgi:predicted nucleic acid-binding Zn finger protein